MRTRHLVRSADGRIGLDMLAVLNEERAEVELETFRQGDVLAVDTQFSTYIFVKQEGEAWSVSTTNPERKHVLPGEGEAVEIYGCTFGGTMLKQNCVFVGGHLEFNSPGVGIVTTSAVERIRARQKMETGKTPEEQGS